MRCRRPRLTGAVTISSPVGAEYSPEAARSASLRSAKMRFDAATYELPAAVSASFRAVRSNSLARKWASSSEIFRLAVATGVLRRRAAAERLPASATANTIDMASRRSIDGPFHCVEQWIPFSHRIHVFGRNLCQVRPNRGPSSTRSPRRGHNFKETEMSKARYLITAAALLALSGTAFAEARPDGATQNIVIV